MKKLILYIAVILQVTTKIFAFDSGEINGRVLDKMTQQPVSGAVVEIIQLNQKAGTDENGYFIFTGLKDGYYSLRISSIGYIPFIKDNIVVMDRGAVNVLVELDIVQTEEITVEAQRFEKPLEISNSFKNLSFEEIRRTPGGFEDIGRVIQTLPGISFINDGRNDLIVRGGAPAENLFLVDGAPVPNINHFGSQGSTGGPASIINLLFVQDVKFLSGGFSARYGDKLSSVIDIIQREGNRGHFMGDLNLSANGFGAVLEGPIGKDKKGSWLLSARRSYLDFLFGLLGFGFIPEYSSFQLKAVYDINDKNTLTFNGIGNIDKVRFKNDTEEKKQDNENILQNNQWGYVNSFELKSLVTKRSYSLINFSRSFTDYRFSGRDANFIEKFRNNSKEGETNLKAEYFWLPNVNSQISFGTGAKLINFRNEVKTAQDTLFVIDPNTGGRYILPALDFNSDVNTFKGNAYIQLTQNLFRKLKLNIGLRYDYFDFINDKNYISPRASATLSLLSNFNLNFSYGIFYQSPSYIWLVSNPQNKNLKNVRADHYIAGLEYLPSGDSRITVEAYYKKYDNYPASTLRPYFVLANNGGDFQNTSAFGLEPLISAGVGYAQGIEFFYQKVLTEKFYTTANLSLFKVRYTSLDGIERSGDYDNGLLFTANGGYILGKGWEFSAKFRFAGGRPYTPINPVNGTQDVSNYNSARYPDFYSLDMRLDKRWNFNKWSLVTYIDIQNITGRKNITRFEWKKYKNEIEANESLGVFPTIGINAMF